MLSGRSVTACNASTQSAGAQLLPADFFLRWKRAIVAAFAVRCFADNHNKMECREYL